MRLSAAHKQYGYVQLNRTDLADFSCFFAIERRRSFRRAELEVGVSAWAQDSRSLSSR
jgi:hypothetical protein